MQKTVSMGLTAATAAVTPLGKRTLSNTSIPENTPSSNLFSSKRATRGVSGAGESPAAGAALRSSSTSSPKVSRPPSPSASHQLSSLKSHYETKLLLSQQSYEELEDLYRGLSVEVEHLKSARRELVEEWERSKEERSREQTEWQQERETLRKEVAALRMRGADQEEEAAEAIQAAQRERQTLQIERTELMTRVSQLEARNLELEQVHRLEEEQRSQVEAAKAKEHDEEIQELQAQLSAAKANSSPATQAENASVNQELHRILKQSRQLEVDLASIKAANTALRKQASASAVLKEENHSLRRKADMLTQLQEEVASLHEREDRRIRELEQWDCFLSSSEVASSKAEATAALAASSEEVDSQESQPLSLPAVPCPLQRSNLPAYLSELRGLASGLLTRRGVLLSKVRHYKDQAEALSSDLEGSRKQLAALREQEDVLKTKEEQWKRSKGQWQDEVSRYRELLKSYELQQQQQQASTSNVAGFDSSTVKNEATEADNYGKDEDEEMMGAETVTSIDPRSKQAYLERIALLEQDVSKKISELDRLSSEHEEHSRHLKSENIAARQEIESMRAEFLQLQRQNALLDEALGKAEERLGVGEFNVEKYRCLVLKRNPVDVDRDLRTKTMDRLKAENRQLIKRVEDLSAKAAVAAAAAAASSTQSEGLQSSDATDDAGGAAGLVPASTLANLREEIADLHASIATKDKAMLRLKQVYTAKASEFREAIQSLFGFKVRFKENGAVQLNSTFARSSSRATSLVFRSEPGNVGRMTLAGEAANDTSLANVPHLREYWLGTGMRQSVPCFLAALQLELYESTTQAVRSAWSVPDADGNE